MESDNNTRKHNTQESKEVSPFPAGDHMAALKEKTRQHNRDKKDPQKKHGPGMVSKKILNGLNMFNGTHLSLNSDVDQDT